MSLRHQVVQDFRIVERERQRSRHGDAAGLIERPAGGRVALETRAVPSAILNLNVGNAADGGKSPEDLSVRDR